MSYTRTTISIPKHVLTLGQKRAAEFRMSFSDYIARLIDRDAREGSKTITIVSEDAGHYPGKKRGQNGRAH